MTRGEIYMSLQEKAIEAIQMLDDQLKELQQIANERRSSEDYIKPREKLERWKERTSHLIEKKINTSEASKFMNKRKSTARINDPWGNLMDRINLYSSFLETLKEEIHEHPEGMFSMQDDEVETIKRQISSELPVTKNVFIVHGHDELNLLRLKEFLKDELHLEPIILSSKAGKGRTLIEKFEEEAKTASYAIALMTPDDIVKIEGEEGYAQSRPNTIFELGWFYGRLGRNKVCILFKKGIKIHSDLDGISRIKFNETVLEQSHEIKKELVEAGVINQ